jgi:signal transduction histidine kinase/CheY-like chemotaxis protein
LVFVLAVAWEFWLEPYLHPSFAAVLEPESTRMHWEYVKTITVFCGLALLVPTMIAAIVERKRLFAIKSLEELQDRTADLLQQRTIEINSVRQQSPSQHQPTEDLIKTSVTLQTIIDSLSESIMVIDLNYNIKMINKAARETYLDDPDDPTPLYCYKISHKENEPCSSPDHNCPIDEVLQTKKQCTVVHKHINKIGAEVSVEILASPIFNEIGEVIGIIESARDISCRLADEEKRKESDMRFYQQQREQSIATLAGGIAHEFNNILTSVLGNAELLSVRMLDNDPHKKQTDAIINGAHLLADLTRQLIAYAKGGKYQSQEISFNSTLQETLELTHTGKFASIEVFLELADDLWMILGDPVQINQLCMNIIINGFEALEITKGNLEIRTSNITMNEKWKCGTGNIHPPGDYVQLEVTNTGSEIPPEIIDKIFDPFFSTKFTGRGLGLAAAKGIVQNHDGCIYVDSSIERTTFYVLLPKALFDQEVISSSTITPVELRGLKILAVDDDPQVLSITENLLTHHGCNVLTTDKGSEALEIISRHKDNLDLVVLDIQMPGMTGDVVYRKLKDINPTIKVLVSSGYEEFTALQNIELSPSDRFIKKPFSMAELMQRINEIVSQE